jgi:hypothetical protein
VKSLKPKCRRRRNMSRTTTNDPDPNETTKSGTSLNPDFDTTIEFINGMIDAEEVDDWEYTDEEFNIDANLIDQAFRKYRGTRPHEFGMYDFPMNDFQADFNEGNDE